MGGRLADVQFRQIGLASWAISSDSISAENRIRVACSLAVVVQLRTVCHAGGSFKLANTRI
jgi:hypothetical protein